MSRVLSLILGGGRGSRLYPLTQHRSKPAVPIGGKYRLIDIPLSNCINSELTRIYVLTQFLSTSLHRHIANTYRFDMFNRGFVEVLAAQRVQRVAQVVPIGGRTAAVVGDNDHADSGNPTVHRDRLHSTGAKRSYRCPFTGRIRHPRAGGDPSE